MTWLAPHAGRVMKKKNEAEKLASKRSPNRKRSPGTENVR